MVRGNSSSYVSLMYRYPRYLFFIIKRCRRIDGRALCISRKSVKTTLDSEGTGVSNTVEVLSTDNLINAKGSIIYRDLNEGVESYSNHADILTKISTFKVDKCGKYINITRDFLCDPSFLKYAYSFIKINQGNQAIIADRKSLNVLDMQ